MAKLKTNHGRLTSWLMGVICMLIMAVLVTTFAAPWEEWLVSADADAASIDAFGLPARTSPLRAFNKSGQIELGRKLFFDRRLSFNGTMSCAMCHVPSQGFTNNTSRVSVGIEGKSLRRNAPTLLNVAWQSMLFHDGRESSLVTQAWMPLLHPDEMGNPSISYVLDRIKALDDYRDQFRHAFSGSEPTMETVGAAIAAYEATLVSANSRFDRWQFGGDAAALSLEEHRGFQIFTGKGRCVVCHVVGENNALFADGFFHITGVGYQIQGSRSFVVPLARNVQTVLTDKDLTAFVQPGVVDLGRYEITLQPADRHAFKTPSLRNVARTAPYMHDGSLASLEAVVEFYDKGGGNAPGKSALLSPLRLTGNEKRELVAFLGTLNGANAHEDTAEDMSNMDNMGKKVRAER